MIGPRAVLIRHGAYHQHAGAPSALQPFPLTDQGKAQARACGEEIVTLIDREGWALDTVMHTSCQLRAWQTGQIVKDVLKAHGHGIDICQTPALAERSVGSAANLTVDQIEKVLAADPRFDVPQPGWKSDSDYCLPLDGAESLMMAGQRVADYLGETMAGKTGSSATLFFGHGASFRHAAHLLGLLSRKDIARYSMFHARPIQICYNAQGRWTHCGGSWKFRHAEEQFLD